MVLPEAATIISGFMPSQPAGLHESKDGSQAKHL